MKILDKEIIQKLLENIPEQLRVLESKVDIAIHMEYIKFHDKVNLENLSEEEMIKESEQLFKPDTALDTRKRILFQLAHLGTVRSYRAIEKYFFKPGFELKEWTSLSLGECRMFLETELTGEDGCFISGGLGGKDNKMRIFVVVVSLDDSNLSEMQKKAIKEEYEIVCKDLNAVLEKVEFTGHYASLTVLVPLDVALDEVVMGGIKKCNEPGEFLLDSYFATNGEIPTHEEILGYIEKIKAE